MFENKEIIHRKYQIIMSEIEQKYELAPVPESAMHFYRLVSLVYHGKLRIYFDLYGWLQISPALAEMGSRDVLGRGLSLFEKDTINLLNERCAEKERQKAIPLLTERCGGGKSL